MNPTQLAEELFSSMHHVTDDLATYAVSMGLSEKERSRLMLTTFLLPFSIACGNATMANDPRLQQLTTETRKVYLGRMSEKEQIVRCGDYVIWSGDRNFVFRTLREQFALVLGDSQMLDHQIRYGTLAHAIASARCETYINDVRIMLETAPAGNFPAMTAMLYKRMITSYNRQIVAFDAMDPNLSNSEIERFQTGVELAIPIVVGLYERASKILKS